MQFMNKKRRNFYGRWLGIALLAGIPAYFLAINPNWLALPEVLCVGGSWLVSHGAPDLPAIEQAACKAAALFRAPGMDV